ncbi:PaaI family thioesterase [Aromatoleum petrolei]|uniref:Hotdog fold thioesterase n=1 Tax=Aromatoleum petrolei TaxID=76116 RepID=A0ABX1MKX0_9RHOO|nr:PaaI family thioesterase [Aromatoleum petrolei]NMF88625.1 hotdog fold thioesterase [Aromatoleum petrolei]
MMRADSVHAGRGAVEEDAAPRGASMVPEGFELIPPFGPFHELTGPLYHKRVEHGYVVGMRVEDKHRNRGQMVHGGMICMLADTAFSWASGHVRPAAAQALTSHLSVGFAGNAKPGDWIEAHVDIVKAGRRVVFSDCFIWCNGKRIAHATAQFQIVSVGGGATD